LSLPKKLKEVIETKDVDVIHPYLVEGMTYKVPHPTSIANLIGVNP